MGYRTLYLLSNSERISTLGKRLVGIVYAVYTYRRIRTLSPDFLLVSSSCHHWAA